MAGSVCNQQALVERHISLCSYLQIRTESAFHPHFPSAELRTHLCREKSNLLVWRRGLCCRPQLFWSLFSMYVGTAMLWSNFPYNLCVLLGIETVSTWVRNFRTNTPKLRMAPSHLFLVLLWDKKKYLKMGRGVSCLFCDDSFGDFVLWTAIDCEINSAACFMIIDWLLIALSHTIQSVWNLWMFLKLVELVRLEFLF